MARSTIDALALVEGFICLAIALGLGLVFALGIFGTWMSRRPRALDRWAATNGFTIVDCEQRGRGPYRFPFRGSDDVRYVTVEDASGNRRSCYAKIGGFFVGRLSNAVDVTWDDQR